MKKKKKTLLITISLIILACIIGTVIYYVNPKKSSTPHSSSSKTINTQKNSPSPTSNNQAQQSPSTDNSNTSNASANTSAKSVSSASQSSGTLEAPFGQFVSNYSPSLGSYEESECETTPGANCYIKFISSSNKTITLQTKTVNAQGIDGWGWSVSSQMGFSPGTWSIQVIASLNGQVKTSTSTMNVQQ